ncbi:MAG: hypothetical protein JW874_11130 [Spirochaetales bacterium]|nr:hypothetical protein [Spirochaetales bacterium]
MKADWGEVVLDKTAKWHGFDFCSHRIWLRRSADVLSVACEESGDPARPVRGSTTPSVKDGPAVSHYRIGPKMDRIEFSPQLPDRAVVITHPDTVYVLPGEELAAWCILPLSVVLQELPDQRPVHEYPTVRLSKTLFGDTDSGEILYSWPKSLALDLADINLLPVEALCPLKIRNNSPDKLLVKRLCVRVEFLSIYRCAGQLCTDQVVFTARGQTQDSQIAVKPFRPAAGEKGEKITGARVSGSGRFMHKSFDFFRSIGQL